MRFEFPKFDKIGAPLLGIAAVALFVLEQRYALRKRVRPQKERLLLNSGVAVAALPALRYLLLPAMYYAARQAKKRRFGLLNRLPLPRFAKAILGFLLLDQSNYLWHVLLHKSDLLWRFHNVHHTDLDLDLSTAWRFHVGENIASVPYRSGMVALLGIAPSQVVWYEVLFEGCTAFHHSNLRLPLQAERVLGKVIVTPRMHGIHHSIVARETNSNYSVVLSCWDRLYNTLNLHVPQHELTIGTPAYRDAAEQTPFRLMRMPFQKQRAWQLPDGTVPGRSALPTQPELPG